MQILEEWRDEEIIVTGLGALQGIVAAESTFPTLVQKYQNTGNFLMILANCFSGSQIIVSEAMATLRILLRRPDFIKFIF